ncbi:MAG TPA: fucose isomerase [Lacipirellulaceae bacterium]|nr:fucose isomerase [Lacipirellulaceae bacterium]
MVSNYKIPVVSPRPTLPAQCVYLMANGDLRLSANQRCWPAQEAMERDVSDALQAAGWSVVRAHSFKEDEEHGFIGSQKEGLAVFRQLDPKAPVIVAEAVWQYSHHILHGLMTHQGPILTLANWSGTWPGLVGMLNLNGSLTKAGVGYSTLWADDFAEPGFRQRLASWLKSGRVDHPVDHVLPWHRANVADADRELGRALAEQLRADRAVMGVFDEGCMGMFNAIIPDHLLNPTGVFKERLSQSALYYETTQTSDDEALAVRRWMEDRGMKFETGPRHEVDLTDEQILLQCKMYIAAMRIADDFGCDLIGIQYQQGLKDLLPASDLVEGTLNDSVRPPVYSRDGRRELYAGEPLPHFNEVDECSGLDGLMTYRVHKAMGQPVENTLHDLRWGDADRSGTTDKFVWVFEISGSVPPSHLTGGWAGATSERQPPMYFPSGGGTIKGVSRPGEIVWSRVFIEEGRLKMDLGRAAAIELPPAETERRWKETTSQWPIMHAVTYGVSRDQMMARHKSNHIQVAYAHGAEEADAACLAKAAMADALGIEASLCGTRRDGQPW